MNIQFVPVSMKNIGTVRKLHMTKEQNGMCENVMQSYIEALVFRMWHPIAIIVDDKMVGFAMYGLWKSEGKNGRVWLDRYFIDENYQGKGYSKIILPALIETITKEYARNTIYLSVYKDNAVAIAIYEKLGFKFNGELDLHGELVMRLN